MLKKVLIVLVLWMGYDQVFAQNKKNLWIDSIFQTLSTEEQIGQLFVIPVSSYDSPREIENLMDLIERNRPGGVIITGGGPVGTAQLINQLQKKSEVPLLVMMDAETGPGKTLDSLMRFPDPLMIGAITNDSLIIQLGREIARQMKVIGANINLAPNADIDIIPFRSSEFYGINKKEVSRKSIMLMKGLQQKGIIAIAKHASVSTDEEKEFEKTNTIDFTNYRLDTLNFYPFDQLIKNGIGGMNTSNLHFSTLDKKKAIPASISKLFVSDVLKKQLNFNGLTATEIPYFHDISEKAKNESEKLAFEVGNDLLINPYNLNASINKIETALKRNAALKAQLEISVKKILAAKYDIGLSNIEALKNDNIISQINTRKADVLNYELSTASITLAKNTSDLIPISALEGKKFASITLGEGAYPTFNHYLQNYSDFESFSVKKSTDTVRLMNQLNNFDEVVIGIFSIHAPERNVLIQWLNRIIEKQKTIVVSFGNPYDLVGLNQPTALLMAYSDAKPIPMLAAQVIFGARQAGGVSPVTINNLVNQGEGSPNNTLDRLAYGIPEMVGMNSQTLAKIDAVVAQALDSGATPGCNIIIARNGQVIFDKAYGWKTYDKAEPVTSQTIYDLASITKVAATLQTVMFMHEKKLIDIDKKISVYLPELKTTNKKDFTIKDVLTHQAGLWPYLPYWLQTMKDSTLLPNYYSRTQNSEYPFPVAKDLFASKVMKDSLWQWIINAKIRDKNPKTPYDYTYSDMGFYIMQHLAEKLLNQPMQDFLSQNIYEPIGATTTGFLPLERFPEYQIAPTEVDKQFRGSKLVGYVHDQGAAMHGGVAGHAGLFSNANDLAKLGQMWLQKGSYGGHQFYKPETIELFTSKQYDSNRRGLGWDKPTISDWNGPTSLYASPKTFGHTGFTGTAVWVDPEFNLVFVFLSNRVYPDMFNTKLLTGNIRPRIQDIIYQSIFDYCKAQN